MVFSQWSRRHILFIVLLSVSLLSSEADARILITVSYLGEWIYRSNSPSTSHAYNESMHFDISGHQIDTRLFNEKIGSSVNVTDSNGLQHTSESHVVHGSFVFVSKYVDHENITVVKTDGLNSCQATRAYVLNKGRTYAVDRLPSGEDVLLVGKKYSNVTCSIASD